MGQSNYVHIEVAEIIRETDKAFWVRVGAARYWLPKSQIADAENYSEGDKDCTMSITEWIAGEKGLEGD